MIGQLPEKLSSRWTPYLAALLAMALSLTSLDAGWQMDDYIHRLLLGERYLINGETVVFDLFRFTDGTGEQTRQLMDYGTLPWWTPPGWKISFWRPLAALTHWIDYRLWPTMAELMHFHSILWFGILVLVVSCLYKRINGVVWVAGLATVLFAIDDAHASAIGWLANRNVIIAATFGVATLYVHDRWRQTQWRPGAIFGPLLLIFSLLAKESAVAVLAYLFSFAVFIDRGTIRNRILSLIPYVLVVSVWRMVWAYAGYGVAGMDLYVDPLQEPLRFAGLSLIRIPILLFGQWVGVPADLNILFSPENVIKLALATVPVLAILCAVFIPVLRQDRVARFWGLGMLLAVIPCASTMSSDRLLFFVGLGAMGLLARFFAFARAGNIARVRIPWRKRGMYIVLAFLILVHLVVPLVALPLRASQPFGSTERVNRLYFTPPANADLEDKTVVLVNAPSILHAAESWSRAVTEKLPLYQRLRVLSSGQSAVTAYRADEHTLIVHPKEGFLSGMFDMLFRSASQPMQTGDKIELDGVSIEIMRVTPKGRPLEARFVFSVPLDDPSLLWFQFVQDGFSPFAPPAVGDSITIPRVEQIF